MNASTAHQSGTPATPRDCPMMQSVLATARQMFPGEPWEDVEPHMRRAWHTINEPVSWEDARPWLQDAWGNSREPAESKSSLP